MLTSQNAYLILVQFVSVKSHHETQSEGLVPVNPNRRSRGNSGKAHVSPADHQSCQKTRGGHLKTNWKRPLRVITFSSSDTWTCIIHTNTSEDQLLLTFWLPRLWSHFLGGLNCTRKKKKNSLISKLTRSSLQTSYHSQVFWLHPF